MLICCSPLLELPPVEAGVARIVAEAEIQVVDTRGIADLCAEGAVFLDGARSGDEGGSDDGSVLAVDAQGDGAGAGRRALDAETCGTLAEVHATELDEFAVVDVVDIHVLLTRRGGHVSHDTRVGDAHLG